MQTLLNICVEAAAQGNHWKIQRRQLERIPDYAANLLLQRILQQEALPAPHLELFRHCVTEFVVPPHLAGVVNSEWIAYLADMRLRVLDLSGCYRLKDASLAPLSRCSPSLSKLSLARCSEGITARSLPLLASLTRLVSLDISSTGIRGPVIATLSVLTALTFLDVGGLEIDNADAAHLASLPRLSHLSLWGAILSNEFLLVGLSTLTYLDISWAVLTCLPVLPNLQVLKACSVALRSILWTAEAGHSNLVELDLSGCHMPSMVLKDLNEIISHAHNLRTLNLASTSFEDLSCFQSGADRLLDLDLSETRVHGNSGFESLLSATQLSRLNLAKTQIDSDVMGILAALPSLQVLDVSHTDVNDDGLAALPLMSKLKELNLSHTSTTWEVEWKLHLAASSMSRRSAESSGMVEEGSSGKPSPRVLALAFLDVAHTLITNAGVEMLAHFAPNLTRLAIGSAKLENRGIRILCEHLTDLRQLSIQECPGIQDYGISTCSELPYLETLEVKECMFIGEACILEILKSSESLRSCLLNGKEIERGAYTSSHARRSRTKKHANSNSAVGSPGAARSPVLTNIDYCQDGTKPPSHGTKGCCQLPTTGRTTVRIAEDVPPSHRHIAYDERIQYSSEELLALRDSVAELTLQSVMDAVRTVNW